MDDTWSMMFSVLCNCFNSFGQGCEGKNSFE